MPTKNKNIQSSKKQSTSNGGEKRQLTQNNDIKQKPATSNPNIKKVKKTPIDYKEILKLAKMNEENIRSTSLPNLGKSLNAKPSNSNSGTETSKVNKNLQMSNKSAIRSSIPASSTSSMASNNKRYLPGDIRSKTDHSGGISNPKPDVKQKESQKLKPQPKQQQSTSNKVIASKSSSISGKTTSIITNESKPVSAWERAIADLKRKHPSGETSNNGFNSKRQIQTDYDDYDDDVEEDDSEMDDFIDDDDEDGRVRGNTDSRTNYSKYIREIFKYNPERYKHLNDEDDPNMEASYNDIMKEERKRFASFLNII